MSYKLIIASHETYHCYCDYECGCVPNIDMRETTLNELAQSGDYQIKADINQLVLSVLENADKDLRALLRQKGWANVDEAKDREEKLTLSKDYLLINKNRPYSGVVPIDLGVMDDNMAVQLADDNMQVAQLVTKPSLKKTFTAKQKQLYNAAVARKKAAKEKKAATAKARAEKKRAK